MFYENDAKWCFGWLEDEAVFCAPVEWKLVDLRFWRCGDDWCLDDFEVGRNVR